MQQNFNAMMFRDKVTRSHKFLFEMEKVIPWSRLIDLLKEWKTSETGRKGYTAETMLRMWLIQNWYGLSDELTEEKWPAGGIIALLMYSPWMYAAIATDLSEFYGLALPSIIGLPGIILIMLTCNYTPTCTFPPVHDHSYDYLIISLSVSITAFIIFLIGMAIGHVCTNAKHDESH